MPEIVVRRATPADAPAGGAICYQAFYDINTAHNFPPDLPGPEAAIGLLSMMFSHPGFYCVVAESGVRLLQAAFHNRSLSLYAKLGFDAREPISTMQGPPIGKPMDGYSVRPAAAADLDACNRVCEKVHGHHRGGELADAIKQGTPMLVERAGRITGYYSTMAFFGHTVGETNGDVQALIASASEFGGPGILVPRRNAALFRWCLENGLRVKYSMTLMSVGMYQEPSGAYLPSILY